MNGKTTQIDRSCAKLMFSISICFLVLLATVLHLRSVESIYPTTLFWCSLTMGVLFPCYIVELALHVWAGSNHWKQNILYCFLPPLRLGGRDHENGQKIWLPWLGWQTANSDLACRLDKKLSLPMIVIALMILPLMGIEFLIGRNTFESNTLLQSTTLCATVHAATGIIWLAFTMEFVVMISMVENKLRYCRDHWIDLAIIFLPTIAFLRCLRVIRLLRLQQMLKFQQIVRTARIWRMRGLSMKLFRSLFMIDAIDRILLRKPESRLAKLEESLADKEQEIKLLRSEIETLKLSIVDEQTTLHESA